jgi:hypothetical protein
LEPRETEKQEDAENCIKRSKIVFFTRYYKGNETKKIFMGGTRTENDKKYSGLPSFGGRT